jgi:hypothetical protein
MPGRVAHHVGDAHHHLVADLFFRDNSDRLRHVTQRRESLGGGSGLGGDVPGAFHDGNRETRGRQLQYEFPGRRDRRGIAEVDDLRYVLKTIGGDLDRIAIGLQIE